ncbi:sel1 repeat family protein [Lentilitoribacter sp. Alg239-R112]|uniref:tetratricopeptide repeat protein n=1 Tax=Lentilitoribacter sp. Alg239-R112 TaxID=2305987 RepID=UPI0013A6C070|nr:sel1 repeat family protein [Lentilitoribacter sp. Alg239-R112]
MEHSFVIKAVYLCISLIILPLDGNASNTPTTKELFAHAEALRVGADVKPDPTAAFQIMMDLAKAGNARAQDKLANYYRLGVGTAVNTENAAAWYKAAIKNGRDYSRVPYARLLLKQNAFADALSQLTLATKADIRGAAALLAATHHDGSFGHLSQRDQGTDDLIKLSQAGDVVASLYLLQHLARGNKFDMDTDRLFQDALQISRDPTHRYHLKTAEVLLAYLRQTNGRKGLSIRAELLQTPNLRGRIWVAESLYFAIETTPETFWKASEKIVISADSESYTRALFLTSRLNKNAYVRILQKELTAHGYKPGRTSGYLTSATIRAITKLCKDIGILNTCRLGPLKSSSIKEIAKWLSNNRQS